MRAHARTLSVIRTLSHFKVPKRRRRMPRQQQPDAIRREYFAAIMPYVDPALAAFARVRAEIVALLAAERKEAAQSERKDADERKARAQKLIDVAAAHAETAWAPTELHAVAMKFGAKTSAFQKAQLSRQVEAAIGVPLAMVEKPITDKLEGFAALNVDLIKTVPERYFDRIRQDVLDAFEFGDTADSLADTLVDRDDVAENDARRIARDQIGKLNAQFNQDRQEAMGVTGYTWRGMMDERERDEHTEREGEHFEWDDPPDDGAPGEAIQCRCYAEPDFDALIEDLDEDG